VKLLVHIDWLIWTCFECYWLYMYISLWRNAILFFLKCQHRHGFPMVCYFSLFNGSVAIYIQTDDMTKIKSGQFAQHSQTIQMFSCTFSQKTGTN